MDEDKDLAPTDAQVLSQLVAGGTVAGYEVKPWTIKQLLLVMPVIDELLVAMEHKGISLNEFDQLIEERGIMILKDLLMAGLPHIPKLLAISLKAEEGEMEELELGQAVEIAMAVLALNLDHLKNAFGLVSSQARTLIR